MRITPGAQPLQTLKAQQAWEARRAARANNQQQPTPGTAPIADPMPSSMASRPEATQTASAPSGNTPAWAAPQWTNKVQEIQGIAERAGFIGVSEQDIRRAYSQGTSLLADYRV